MIRLIDAEKVYDNGTRALKGVSFTVDDGEFVFLVGPSGSGKSTIIKLMTGEVVPTAGRVMVNGFSMSRIAEKQIPYMRRTIGVIFQDFRLIGNKTVRDNLALAMRAVGASPRELKNRIPYVLELVGLADKENSYPDQLSGGEQQRVAIARALVNNPSTIGPVTGDHDAAGAHQRPGDHGDRGDPREGPGQPLQQADHPAERRAGHRRRPGQLRGVI